MENGVLPGITGYCEAGLCECCARCHSPQKARSVQSESLGLPELQRLVTAIGRRLRGEVCKVSGPKAILIERARCDDVLKLFSYKRRVISHHFYRASLWSYRMLVLPNG
jgi:hypothetical protein